MTRPITLFTGQWADLPFEEVCRLAAAWGYDGLEIACWGDHFEVDRALAEDDYVEGRKEILEQHGLEVWAISNHLVGQAVCDDPIDARHKDILPAAVWGDGDPEGVRQRAAEAMKDTARAAAKLGVDVVIGFTGSAIWKYVAMFPPVGADVIEAGYQDFADRWNPILDVFDEEGVRFAHEVHPSEIAYDYWTTVRTLEAIGHRPAFGLNWDPSHMVWQDIDPVGFIWDFQDRIYHVDCKDTKRRVGNGRNGRLGSHLPWADPRRGWDFVSTGHGDVPWEDCFRMLNAIGYDGPISVEWEDAGMDRLLGAAEAARVRPRAWPSTRPTARSTPPSAPATEPGAGLLRRRCHEGMPSPEASRRPAGGRRCVRSVPERRHRGQRPHGGDPRVDQGRLVDGEGLRPDRAQMVVGGVVVVERAQRRLHVLDLPGVGERAGEHLPGLGDDARPRRRHTATAKNSQP